MPKSGTDLVGPTAPLPADTRARQCPVLTKRTVLPGVGVRSTGTSRYEPVRAAAYDVVATTWTSNKDTGVQQ
eukprot:2603912-Rhodomonas_salina.1